MSKRSVTFMGLGGLALTVIGVVISSQGLPGILLTIPGGAVVGTAIGIGAISALTEWQVKKEREHDPYLYPQAHKPKKGQTHCSDCGSEFEVDLSSRGYDPETGDPKFQPSLRCPNYEAAEQRRWATYSGSGMGWRLQSPVPNCGEHKKANEHWTHSPGVVSTDCLACIKQMREDRIISAEQALELIGKVS